MAELESHLVLAGHTSWVSSVTFLPCGQRLATGSGDCTARVWDANTGAWLLTLARHRAPLVHVEASPAGLIFTRDDDGITFAWSAASGRAAEPPAARIAFPQIPEADITAAAAGARGAVAVGTSDGHVGVARVLWAGGLRNDGIDRDAWNGGNGGNEGNGGVYVYVGGVSGGALGVWVVGGARGCAGEAGGGDGDGDGGAWVRGVHTDWVNAVAFSPSGGWLASGSADGTAAVVGLAAPWGSRGGGEVVAILEHGDAVEALAWDPSGSPRLVTAGADGVARVWDARAGARITDLLGHDAPLRSVAFSPCGSRVATAGEDATVRVWDAANGQPLHSAYLGAGPVEMVAYAPCGTRVAAACRANVAVVVHLGEGAAVVDPGLEAAASAAAAARVDTADTLREAGVRPSQALQAAALAGNAAALAAVLGAWDRGGGGGDDPEDESGGWVSRGDGGAIARALCAAKRGGHLDAIDVLAGVHTTPGGGPPEGGVPDGGDAVALCASLRRAASCAGWTEMALSLERTERALGDYVRSEAPRAIAAVGEAELALGALSDALAACAAAGTGAAGLVERAGHRDVCRQAFVLAADGAGRALANAGGGGTLLRRAGDLGSLARQVEALGRVCVTDILEGTGNDDENDDDMYNPELEADLDGRGDATSAAAAVLLDAWADGVVMGGPGGARAVAVPAGVMGVPERCSFATGLASLVFHLDGCAAHAASAVRSSETLKEAAVDHRRWVGAPRPTSVMTGELAEREEALRRAREALALALVRAEFPDPARPAPTRADIAALRAAVASASRGANDAAMAALRTASVHFPELRAGALAGAGVMRDLYESGGLVLDRLLRDYDVDTSAPLAAAGDGVRQTVLRARFSGEERALKEFRGAITEGPDGERRRRRFAREVLSLSRAQHRNVAELGCAFIDGADAYLDMPLYAGGDLAAWLAARDRPYVDRHRVLAGVARGLEFIHRSGITHCDVKPRNVLMESDADDAVPRVADFDASRDEGERHSELLATSSASLGRGGVAGTLGYTGPELFGEGATLRSVTPAVDVYAFGVMVAEVLAPASFASLRHAGAMRPGEVLPVDRLDPPTEVAARADLADLLRRACARDPSVRPSMAEVIEHPFFSAPLAAERLAVTRHAERLAAESLRVETRRAELATHRAAIDARVRDAAEERRRAEDAVADARRRGAEVDAAMRRAEREARTREREILERQRAAEAEAIAVAGDRARLAAERAGLESERTGVREKEAEVAEREARVARLHRHLRVPQHWTARASLAPPPGGGAFGPAARVDVTQELGARIEKLMNDTSVREAGWIAGGQDNRALRHRAFRVERVTRIENPRLMREYAFQREQLGVHPLRQVNVKTFDRDLWRAMRQDRSVHEVFLFHGCRPEIAGVIAEQGFNERVCRLEGLFGAAVYFAECASKSNEYAAPGPGGSAFMFLSRVTLGRPYEAPNGTRLSRQRRAPCLQGGHTECNHERADSVIAIGSQRFGYREFMIYDGRQSYPELLIEFKRV